MSDSGLFDFVLQTSIGASILIVAALIVRTVLRPWLPTGVLYLISTVVIVRLVFPFSPTSEYSLLATNGGGEVKYEHHAGGDFDGVVLGSEHSITAASSDSVSTISFSELLVWIWAIGFVFFIVSSMVRYLRFRTWLAQQPETSDPRLLGLIDTCARRTDVRGGVAVHVVDRVNTPAVFGIFHPHILLPQQMVESLGDDDLRHVLLHELMHIRRRDVLIGALATFIGALHWFNPLAWLAIRQFSTDREVLCDRAVLKALGGIPSRSRAYGETIVRMVAQLSMPARRIPGFVPFLGHGNETRERIVMISKFGKTKKLSTFFGLAALITVSHVAFTVAAPADNPEKEKREYREGEGRGEHEGKKGHGERERGEHDRDGEGHHGLGEKGEESGKELKLNQKYDRTRNGARLILAYDPKSNSFKGTVENTTKKTLERVRVEVHLSNGKELGPTRPRNLKAGKKRKVTLKAKSRNFDGWTAHPEVGNEEHGERGEGEHGRRERGEHGKRERGEHDREGRGEHKDRERSERHESERGEERRDG